MRIMNESIIPVEGDLGLFGRHWYGECLVAQEDKRYPRFAEERLFVEEKLVRMEATGMKE